MRDSPAVQDALDELSLGARMRPLYDVQQRQLLAGLQAQMAGTDTFTLTSNTFFERDPASEVEECLQRGWMLAVRVPTFPPLRALRATLKTDLHTWLENLRREKRAQGISFEQQLEQEFGGRFAAIQSSIREMQSALAGERISDPLNTDREIGVERGLMALRSLLDLRGTGATADQIREFLSVASPYRRALPCEDVFCQLFARLVTQAEGVEESDSSDVDHMALVVPIVSVVVTDVVLAQAIRRLGLDNKYQCNVFSMRDADDVIRTLESF